MYSPHFATLPAAHAELAVTADDNDVFAGSAEQLHLHAAANHVSARALVRR